MSLAAEAETLRLPAPLAALQRHQLMQWHKRGQAASPRHDPSWLDSSCTTRHLQRAHPQIPKGCLAIAPAPRRAAHEVAVGWQSIESLDHESPAGPRKSKVSDALNVRVKPPDAVSDGHGIRCASSQSKGGQGLLSTFCPELASSSAMAWRMRPS